MELKQKRGVPVNRDRGYAGPFIFCLLVILLFSLELYPQKFKEVEVDISSGTFKEYLPFDMHFLIKGIAPEEVTEITAWYLEKKKGEIGNMRMSPFDEDSEVAKRWRKIELSWKRTSPSDDKFFILAPPLKAKRYYQFYFQFSRPLDKEELNQFKNKLIASFDLELQKKGKIKELTDDDIPNLQEKLIEALPKPGKGMSIIPAPGSIFEKGAEGETNLRKKINAVVGLLEPLLERDSVITEFKDHDQKAGANLARFRGNKILQAVHAVIQLNQNKYQYLFKQNNLAIRLANLSEFEAAEIARGEKSFVPLESEANAPGNMATGKIDELWNPGECDIRIGNLGELSTSLGEIHSLLNSVLVEFAFFRQQHEDIQKKADLEKLMADIQEYRDTIDGQQHRLNRIKNELSVREKRISDLAEQITVLAQTEAFVVGDSGGEFKTRASWYLSPDIGLAYAPKMEEFVPYFGVNIYLRPVNREVPLGMKDSLGRRFALMVGVTTRSIEVEDQRTDLFGNKALVVGAGLRLTDIIRVTGGALVYYKIETGAEETQKKLATSYFVALSLDWDIKTTIGMLGDALLGK